VVAVVAVLVLLAAAASLTFALSRRPGHGASPVGSSAGTSRGLAAAWVASQVSRGAVVSCDPVMCRALTSRGVPASDLYPIGRNTNSPLPSDVVVATAAIRSKFGNLLGAVYAPEVIAGFGSGQGRIDVRAVALHGASAYRAALHRDLVNRRTAGAEMLRNTRIAASALARGQLLAGQADARLLNAIAVMAARQPIYLVAFRSFAPGAATGMPLRYADVAAGGSARQRGPRAAARFVRSMVAFLDAQHAPYRPAHLQAIRLPQNEVRLRIGFAAPSPLGLLGP
jgi:hypothetical protein